MSRSRRSFTPEFKEEAAKLVVESTRPVASVAREVGVNEQTLRNWVNDYRTRHAADEPALTVTERARLRELESGAVFHSDRGSNYTSAQFADTLRALDIRGSVGRTGVCWDNAMAESFFGTLKNERVHRVIYPTRAAAAADVVQWIELHYNNQRLHSGLGYKTPHEIYHEFLNRQQAA